MGLSAGGNTKDGDGQLRRETSLTSAPKHDSVRPDSRTVGRAIATRLTNAASIAAHSSWRGITNGELDPPEPGVRRRMLVLDQSVMTALVIGGDDLQEAQKQMSSESDFCSDKNCMMALSFRLMRDHGMEIMRKASATLEDLKITIVPENPEIVGRANDLLSTVRMTPPHRSGFTVDICDCIAWAIAESEGGKLATLNVALREHAIAFAVPAD